MLKFVKTHWIISRLSWLFRAPPSPSQRSTLPWRREDKNYLWETKHFQIFGATNSKWPVIRTPIGLTCQTSGSSRCFHVVVRNFAVGMLRSTWIFSFWVCGLSWKTVWGPGISSLSMAWSRTQQGFVHPNGWQSSFNIPNHVIVPKAGCESEIDAAYRTYLYLYLYIISYNTEYPCCTDILALVIYLQTQTHTHTLETKTSGIPPRNHIPSLCTKKFGIQKGSSRFMQAFTRKGKR